MKRIAVLSDTHGLLREEVKSHLETVDLILHAGDVHNAATLQTLRALGECYIVKGNNDWGLPEALPKSLTVTIEGVRFFMVHYKQDVPKHLTDIDVIVYGHSHQYAQTEHNGVLWFNPGSCGPRRFDYDITMSIMTLHQGYYQIEKILL